MAQSIGIPSGTRDFSPIEMARRNYIFSTIRSVFSQFGFQQIETPAMEHLSTLMGKYGEEGDKLLFKILNSGDAFAKLNPDELLSTPTATKKTCEKGLRYDLTVPFARYVVQHQSEITFPFKRYQIQAVWRADRPQKGRYREFYQCDADIIGSTSLLNEVELIKMIDRVFSALRINVCIKINNRKILAGIAEYIGYPEALSSITVAIDKIDKIGLPKVCEDLSQGGISDEAIQKLKPILSLQGDNQHKIKTLRSILDSSEIGLLGLDEIAQILHFQQALQIQAELELDLSLARGLSYYTGAILEVKAKDVAIGSISGGGRYDDLTGIFGLKQVSGVGISFGADRIYDVLLHLDAFPESTQTSTQLLFAHFGPKEVEYILPIANRLREKGLSVEIYPEAAKMKKQFDYANKRQIPWMGIVGETELNSGMISLKNMSTGEQKLYSTEEIERLMNC